MWLDLILTILCAVFSVFIIYYLLAATKQFQALHSDLAGLEISSITPPAISPDLTILETVLPDHHEPDQQHLPLYIASSKGDRFHRSDCSWALRIHEQNRQYFEDRDAAVESGFKPCNICLP